MIVIENSVEISILGFLELKIGLFTKSANFALELFDMANALGLGI